MRRTLGWLRMEPSVERPPVRARRDWLLVAAVAGTAVAEVVVRDDLLWRPVALLFGLALALSMPWRRARPLATVVVAFGALAVIDLASALTADGPFFPYAGAFVLVLLYALLRWGTTGQVAIGSVVVSVEWLVAVTTDSSGLADAVGGLFVLLFVAALGVAVRYRSIVRTQEFERVRLHERDALARELHDTVAHHGVRHRRSGASRTVSRRG